MRRWLPHIVILLVCTVVAAPAVAQPKNLYDCVKPFRLIGPINITRADIRIPTESSGKPASYKLNSTWMSVDLKVSQYVQIKNGPRFYGSSFSAQKAISIDAYSPEDQGFLWVDDNLPSTSNCQMLGRQAWQAPRVFVRETGKAVYVAAASQPTPGDHTGCALGPQYGTYPCPLLTRAIIKLKKVVGKRKIVLENWAPNVPDGMPIAPTASLPVP